MNESVTYFVLHKEMTHLKLVDSFVYRLLKGHKTQWLHTQLHSAHAHAHASVLENFRKTKWKLRNSTRKKPIAVYQETLTHAYTRTSVRIEMKYILPSGDILPLLLFGFVEFCVELLVAGNLIELIAALKFCGNSVWGNDGDIHDGDVT